MFNAACNGSHSAVATSTRPVAFQAGVMFEEAGVEGAGAAGRADFACSRAWDLAPRGDAVASAFVSGRVLIRQALAVNHKATRPPAMKQAAAGSRNNSQVNPSRWFSRMVDRTKSDPSAAAVAPSSRAA